MLLAQPQPLNLNQSPIRVMDEGVYVPATVRAYEVNCSGAGITCTQSASRMTISVAGGSFAPTDGEYVTYSANATLTNERVLSAGNYTVIDNATVGQSQVDWQHGLTCSAGQALTTSGTTALVCTSTLTASSVSCSGCVADSALASNYSGTGVCGANTFATTLNDNAAPTCSAVNDATSILTGGIRLTNDLGGTAAAPAVVDDSHNHTGATISALDTADITTGTLGQARGGTGAGSLTCGAGDFLTSNGTVYSCATPGGASPLTTKGDLYTFTTVDARKPVGADGLCLKANSAEATGLEWGACGGAGSGTSVEQSVVLTAGGFFSQSVSLAATTATSKFVCRPFGTTADSLTPEVIAIAGLQATVSDLSAGVGFTLNVWNPNGLVGTVRFHCTTGG